VKENICIFISLNLPVAHPIDPPSAVEESVYLEPTTVEVKATEL